MLQQQLLFLICNVSTHRINLSEMSRRGDGMRVEINTWFGTSNFPPSKAGGEYHFNGAFEKHGRKSYCRAQQPD